MTKARHASDPCGSAKRARWGGLRTSIAIARFVRVSPERRREQQAAVLPQSVLSAAQAEPRTFAEMPLENLAVIPDLLDRLIGPVGREAVLLAEIVADAEQALDLGHLALFHLIHIGLRDAEFFGG